MIKISTKFKMSVPNMDFTEDLRLVASRIVIPMIEEGIRSGMAIDGTMLPENEPETRKRKGHGQPLIETGTLGSSFYFVDLQRNKIKVAIAASRKLIGEYLQIDGVRTKKKIKFYRFFGLNRFMSNSAKNFMSQKIKEKIDANRS